MADKHSLSTRPSWGILDTYKVRCAICGDAHRFNPPHSQAHRARVHARALGWTYDETRGWVCPRSHRTRPKGDPERAQATLPGFGVLSRNAKA